MGPKVAASGSPKIWLQLGLGEVSTSKTTATLQATAAKGYQYSGLRVLCVDCIESMQFQERSELAGLHKLVYPWNPENQCSETYRTTVNSRDL